MTVRTRILALAAPADAAAVAPLQATEGVAAVRLLPGGRRIEVAYDLRRTGLAELEHRLAFLGLPLSQGLLARLGRRIAAFRDENLRAQLKIVHQCCSVPPRKGGP